ncbi:MAG: hypothetical protein K8F36_03515 [Melioribacteraceae bacterium]|nr:hypothetical protein [Melioribacteraceae bacterium]
MKSQKFLIILFGLLFLTLINVQAQKRGFAPNDLPGFMSILEELELTEEQQQKLDKILEERKNAFENRRPRLTENREPFLMHEKLSEILNDEQKEKLAEMREARRAEFFDKFAAPRMERLKEELNLTDEQMEKIEEMYKERREFLVDSRRDYRFDRRGGCNDCCRHPHKKFRNHR